MEEPEEEAPPPVGKDLRRFRPTRREEIPPELIDRYEAARAAVIQGEEGADVLLARVSDELLGHMTDEDTEALVRGEKVTVTAAPDPPGELDERLEILNQGWEVACTAWVVEVLPENRYVLQGDPRFEVPYGHLDD